MTLKIAITGHRPNKLGNDYNLTSDLVKKIKYKIVSEMEAIINDNVGKKFILITGMALGIDTLFAHIAIEKRLKFIAAIPCIGQEAMWRDEARKLYHKILKDERCIVHMVTNKPYDLKCMNLRNEWMVDNCDVLIAVWDGTSGGTANCVKYAKSKNKNIKPCDNNIGIYCMGFHIRKLQSNVLG